MTTTNNLLTKLLTILDDAKALDVLTIDVSKQTSITDYMVICTGRSSRHVKAIADQAMESMKAAHNPALRNSGLNTGEWVLVDFGDFILHVMTAESREFYDLEGHWQSN
jgi:ribosome-associated protein